MPRSLFLSLSLWLAGSIASSLAAVAHAQTPAALPCSAASAECARLLADLAIKHNIEIKTLDEAIKYQRARRWSSWMNADGLNPLAVGFRVARNITGGGDVAATKLEIAQLERRRAEVETALRLSVAQSLADLDAATRKAQAARARLAAHQARAQLLGVGYKFGDGSTEEMLQVWQAGEELKLSVQQFALDEQTAVFKLLRVVAKSDGMERNLVVVNEPLETDLVHRIRTTWRLATNSAIQTRARLRFAAHE